MHLLYYILLSRQNYNIIFTFLLRKFIFNIKKMQKATDFITTPTQKIPLFRQFKKQTQPQLQI